MSLAASGGQQANTTSGELVAESGEESSVLAQNSRGFARQTSGLGIGANNGTSQFAELASCALQFPQSATERTTTAMASKLESERTELALDGNNGGTNATETMIDAPATLGRHHTSAGNGQPLVHAAKSRQTSSEEADVLASFLSSAATSSEQQTA